MPLDRIQIETVKNRVLMSFIKAAAFFQQMKSTAGYIIKVNSPPNFTTNYKTHPPLVHL